MSVPHPSEFIVEELNARHWGYDDLAMKMGELGDGFADNRVMLDIYEVVGPTETGMRMGDEMSSRIAEVFGVSQQFLLNLERAWLTDNGVPAMTTTPDSEMVDGRPECTDADVEHVARAIHAIDCSEPFDGDVREVCLEIAVVAIMAMRDRPSATPSTQSINALQGTERHRQRTQDGFGRQDMVDGDGRG